MDAYDVLIIGGGPAGSTCAGRLKRAGWKALLLDKASFPRNKPCAGWITPQVVEELELDPGEYSQGRVWQPILGFRTGVIGGGEVEIPYSKPVSFGIRRCEFDAYLLRRAGVECRLGEAVQDLRREGKNWVVNGRYRTPLLIGAGGHFCPVARHLDGSRDAAASVVLAREVEFAAAAEDLRAGTVQAETPELFFCPDLKGYGWCFRKGDYLNIGLGRLDSHQLPKHVEEFCDFLRARNKVACEIPPKFSGHAYKLYERRQPLLFDEGVLLIGDAAGLAYPQSGEGIRPAVESGLIAAEVVQNAEGDYRRENLAGYQTQILERFGKPRSGDLAGWLPAAWLHWLASKTLATRWFAKHVVLNQWFLHQKHPPLPIPAMTTEREASGC